MIVFLNGQFVGEDQALVSVFDRGFLYGDGLAEVLRILNGNPFRWDQHLDRLQRGADFLWIRVPFQREALRAIAKTLVAENQMPDCLLRISLSRGKGVRGYSPKGANEPTLVMSLHPAPRRDPLNPPCWRLTTSSIRLPANNPLARYKTSNKLPQILARAEADAAGADEALLLNTDGHVVEGSSSNLFWVDNGGVRTAPLASGILEGVTRSVVFELCQGFGLEVQETVVAAAELGKAQGIFLSVTSVGIAEVISIDNRDVFRSTVPSKLLKAYLNLLDNETSQQR